VWKNDFRPTEICFLPKKSFFRMRKNDFRRTEICFPPKKSFFRRAEFCFLPKKSFFRRTEICFLPKKSFFRRSRNDFRSKKRGAFLAKWVNYLKPSGQLLGFATPPFWHVGQILGLNPVFFCFISKNILRIKWVRWVSPGTKSIINFTTISFY
jgi:hypothetical protein